MVLNRVITPFSYYLDFHYAMARYYSFDCEAFNIIFNYVFAIFTPPGYSSDYFHNIQDDEEQNSEELENIPFAVKEGITVITADYSYCDKCHLPKPQRAHHCSICNKCVFKMDHHCPWINNCVGHHNHRYFLLFIIYLTIGFAYASLLSLFVYHKSNSQFTRVFVPFNLTLTVVMTVFSGWNWFLAVKG